jgi:anti-sigma B factor antagonist
VSDRRPTQVVIDATALEFVDTSGLRALLRAADTVAEAGARMGVVNPNSQLQRLLEMTDSGSRVGYEA